MPKDIQLSLSSCWPEMRMDLGFWLALDDCLVAEWLLQILGSLGAPLVHPIVYSNPRNLGGLIVARAWGPLSRLAPRVARSAGGGVVQGTSPTADGSTNSSEPSHLPAVQRPWSLVAPTGRHGRPTQCCHPSPSRRSHAFHPSVSPRPIRSTAVGIVRVFQRDPRQRHPSPQVGRPQRTRLLNALRLRLG